MLKYVAEMKDSATFHADHLHEQCITYGRRRGVTSFFLWVV